MRKSTINITISLLVLSSLLFAVGKSGLILDEAIKQAIEEDKLIFVMFGHKGCWNCQQLDKLIESKILNLEKEGLVYAFIDSSVQKNVNRYYSLFKTKGDQLPFVVITDPTGKELIGRSGHAGSGTYKKLIKKARKLQAKAAKK